LQRGASAKAPSSNTFIDAREDACKSFHRFVSAVDAEL
jgi:hypothetical protein